MTQRRAKADRLCLVLRHSWPELEGCSGSQEFSYLHLLEDLLKDLLNHVVLCCMTSGLISKVTFPWS